MSNPKNQKNILETMLVKLVEKVDTQHGDLDIRLDNIEKVMIAQEINLKEHMRRSDQLENIISSIQDKELKPLHKHVNQVEGVFKFLGLIAVIVGIIGGIGKLFGFV